MDLPHLIAARALPDGTFSYEQQRPDIATRIREGDATLGWLGDDRLSLNCTADFEGTGVPRWEIWRAHEQGDPTMVAWKLGTLEPDGLIRNLARHDTRTHDVGQEILDARDAREARLRKDGHDESEGIADKLAWAIGKDLSLPAQSGRPYGTGR